MEIKRMKDKEKIVEAICVDNPKEVACNKYKTGSKNQTYSVEPTPTINGMIRASIIFAQCKENRNKGTATVSRYPLWLGDDGAPGKDHDQ
jgi:hypothetical protein